jgi:hypothetical protein
MMGTAPLVETRDDSGRRAFTFPSMEGLVRANPSWSATLDTLRAPRRSDQAIPDWRREAPIRPVVFEDTGVVSDDVVHLHLEQRVAQRLLARFRSQGFVYHDLARACVAQAVDSIPRVVLLGRLSLYGKGAERLHEELVTVAARWSDPAQRRAPLRAYAREAEERTLELLERALGESRRRSPAAGAQQRLLVAATRDIEELLPQLEPRAQEFAELAMRRLVDRGEREAHQLRQILTAQRRRVQEELQRRDAEAGQGFLGFSDEERRQLDADMHAWRERLIQFDRDLEHEPGRIRGFYEVRATRVEPVGLVYLWPDTN